MAQLNILNKNGRRDRAGLKPTHVFCVLVTILALSLTIPGVPAPTGEVYTLTFSPTRAQESNAPGVTLYLNITNGLVGSRYQVTFSVADPSGSSHNAANTTTPTSTSFILSVVYPRDFGAGVSVRYIGNYTVTVSQNQPSNKPLVATGHFQVGLTDSTVYQRTSSISILATGYTASENVSTSLLYSGIPAPGFPAWESADSGGNLNFSWRIPPSESLGIHTLTLTGSRTTKSVPDSQTLTIKPTTISIPGLVVNTPSLSRSLTQQFLFSPIYPDGGKVLTGQAGIRIAESDGVTQVNVTGSYDALSGNFRATYKVPRDGVVGIWIATLDPSRFDDGYGNLGPKLAVSTGFYVQPATLNVTVLPNGPSGKTFTAGDTIPIYVSVNYPDGTDFSSGVVIAKVSHQGLLIGSPVTLSYISGQKEWAGTYQVASSDPSGIWLVTVDASDQISDSGEQVSSVAVSITPTTSQSTGLGTYSYLFIASIIAAGALVALLWALLSARRRVTHSLVKLDLRLVDKEVDKIQDSQFFQNVKKQVEENSSSEGGSSSTKAVEDKDSSSS